ncbi:MAG: rhodanese-like domain-containing protein [Gammaproteobacteria bacterium]|nr:rhodanese-like domain-containing protein [Gammaproteobacteria bacterium]MDH5799650.1 rhodanese-like domain-containing protein [Gammaproteobacteria bacterium]
MVKSFMLSVLLGVMMSQTWAADKEFPGRDVFPEVKYIELKDLYTQRKDVHIVDVRSTYEYQTLRIENAINIPLASKTFAADMQKLRASSDRPIVVYCNGKTCMKSYKAARKAKNAKIDNVVAYDAGVLDWAKAYPKNTMLISKTLRDPNLLISKTEFEKHSLTPDQFGERLASTEDIVLDVRDRFQREALSIFVGREYRVFLDDTKKLDRYIKKAKREGKGLLIYDAAGKQVRWLQYHLKEMGVTDYHFMKGGIHAYFKEMKNGN